MADVGSSFPASFAMGILQLAQQRKIKDAELAEMRTDRASRNFLDQQRIDLQRQGQFQQNLLANNQLSAQQDESAAKLEVEKQAQLARIGLETERIKQEREGAIAKSFDDFGRTGTAFVPNYGLDKISALTNTGTSEFSIAQIPIPGHGVLLQRIGDPNRKAAFDDASAKLDKLHQDIAVGKARQSLIEAQTAKQTQDANSLVGKLGGPTVVTSIRKQWDGLQKQSQDKLNALNLLDKTPEGKARAARISIDPREAFVDDPKMLSLYDGTQTAIQALTSSISAGLDINKVQTHLPTTDALGVTQAFTTPTTAPEEKIVGKVSGPPTKSTFIPATTLTGETSSRIAPERSTSTAAGPSTYQLITSSGRKIPVSAEEFAKTPVGSPVAPSPLPGTQATTPAQSSASPEARAALDTEGLAQLKIFQDPKATPEQKSAARQRMIEIKKALTQ